MYKINAVHTDAIVKLGEIRDNFYLRCVHFISQSVKNIIVGITLKKKKKIHTNTYTTTNTDSSNSNR